MALSSSAEYDLGYAGAVAQIDENKLAQIAAPIDPSHEHDFFTGIGEAKLSAHMSSFEVA